MFVQKIKFDVLDEKSKENFQKLFDEYTKKIDHKLKNIELFRVHLKEYNERGEIGDKQRKFSIHIHLSGSGKTFEADAHDWDLKRAFHKVFTKIENEIEHVFHVSDQNKRLKKSPKHL